MFHKFKVIDIQKSFLENRKQKTNNSVKYVFLITTTSEMVLNTHRRFNASYAQMDDRKSNWT
jgi:hypothetical protein